MTTPSPVAATQQHRRLATGIAVVLASLLVCFGLLAGCAPQQSASTAESSTVTVTDMLGRSVEVPGSVERIVGIGSSSLRLISYLEATDLVVGVEQSELEDNVTCTYRHVYHEKFSQLPVIGDGGSRGVTPNEEAIAQVRPEVIFASIDADTADNLQQRTGIPVVCLTLSDVVFDQVFYNNVNLVGSIVGKQERAGEIVAYMQETEQDLSSRTADIPEADVKTAYAAGISFRGGHGFAGTEAGFPPFDVANLTNIADVPGASGAFDIDLEQVLAAQPNLVFVESGNLSLVAEDYAANPGYFASLEAVNSGNVYSLISYRFYATNIDLALANCYQVGAVAYPDRFADIDPTEKLNEITEFFLGSALSSDLAAEGCTFQQVNITQL